MLSNGVILDDVGAPLKVKPGHDMSLPHEKKTIPVRLWLLQRFVVSECFLFITIII